MSFGLSTGRVGLTPLSNGALSDRDPLFAFVVFLNQKTALVTSTDPSFSSVDFLAQKDG